MLSNNFNSILLCPSFAEEGCFALKRKRKGERLKRKHQKAKGAKMALTDWKILLGGIISGRMERGRGDDD